SPASQVAAHPVKAQADEDEILLQTTPQISARQTAALSPVTRSERASTIAANGQHAPELTGIQKPEAAEKVVAIAPIDAKAAAAAIQAPLASKGAAPGTIINDLEDGAAVANQSSLAAATSKGAAVVAAANGAAGPGEVLYEAAPAPAASAVAIDP